MKPELIKGNPAAPQSERVQIDVVLQAGQMTREQAAPVVIKEQVAAKGWRFVPHRDENNLIVEIIATPIE